MISYDLNSPTNNRKAVEDSIKSLGYWVANVSTTFIVSSYKNLDDVQSIVTKTLIQTILWSFAKYKNLLKVGFLKVNGIGYIKIFK